MRMRDIIILRMNTIIIKKNARKRERVRKKKERKKTERE